ncbi:LOW QUALITY PROTEIN: hypothetical protein HID58_058381 [Brassica napus]|uniref:Heme O synthase n=1 Tax=Brassica napus TaxID=3708 RepID=A0ABQ7ZPV4_BRANA|nr:LOW QUALITY PROTEIN: hypothetical protein HID58_058381 [Brassica napus]
MWRRSPLSRFSSRLSLSLFFFFVPKPYTDPMVSRTLRLSPSLQYLPNHLLSQPFPARFRRESRRRLDKVTTTLVVTGSFPKLDSACSWLRHLALVTFSVRGTLRLTYLMKRTMRRPLPSGRISVPHAVAWAVIAGASGACLLASKTNMVAAGLGAANLVLYAFVYTPLKQLHPVNTWVGAVVGAIPPLLGWAAASGQISLNSMILPAALYFWQIPHFMALAHLCRSDYAAGGYKMLSLFDPTGKRTAAVALRNCFYMVPLGGLTSSWFCIESTLLTMAIAATAFSFYRHGTMEKARKMLHASLLFLPVFMSGLLIHRVYDDNQQPVLEVAGLSNSASGEVIQTQRRKKRAAQAPVAYSSAAPFPFLPAPSLYSP